VSAQHVDISGQAGQLAVWKDLGCFLPRGRPYASVLGPGTGARPGVAFGDEIAQLLCQMAPVLVPRSIDVLRRLGIQAPLPLLANHEGLGNAATAPSHAQLSVQARHC